MARLFDLLRAEDVSGVSGTGRVAQGVEFDGGIVVLGWFGQGSSISIWPNLAAMEAIHGHQGKTRVEWIAQPASPCRVSARPTPAEPRRPRLARPSPPRQAARAIQA